MTRPLTDDPPPQTVTRARDPRRAPGGWGAVSGRIFLPLQARHRRQHGGRLIARVAELMRLPPDAARRVTVERLRRLLEHARATAPFWRARMEEAGFEPRRLEDLSGLEALPPLTKADIGAHGGAMLSTVYRGRELVQTYSGGTTGTPMPLAQAPAAVAWKSATATVLRRNMGWHPGDRVALLWGAPRDFPVVSGPRWRRLKDLCIGRWGEHIVWLPADVLDDETLDRHTETIERFRPHVIQAYPSGADLLARRLAARGKRLDVGMVLLTAETIYPAQRQRIADALGAQVFTFYGAREVGWIAEECPAEHRLHLNVPGVHVETTEDGRLLVTDLVDPATPLIRYEIGDRGRLAAEPCPCGDPRPAFEAVEGRSSEAIPLPAGGRLMWPTLDARSLGLQHGIEETQFLQHALDRCEIRWVAAPSFRPEQLEAYVEFVRFKLGAHMHIEWTRVDRIEPEPNGKVRYCKPYRGA